MGKGTTEALTFKSGITAVMPLLWMAGGLNVGFFNLQGFFFSILGIIGLVILCICNYKEAWTAIGLTFLGSCLCAAFYMPEKTGSIAVFFIATAIIPVIIAIYKTMIAAMEKAVESAEKAISWVVQQFVDIFTLKAEVKKKCPVALKMKIMEKKKNAVNVGIFNSVSDSTPNQILTIKSTEGISPDIRVGEVYMLND